MLRPDRLTGIAVWHNDCISGGLGSGLQQKEKNVTGQGELSKRVSAGECERE